MCGGADAGGSAELHNMQSLIHNASEYAEELRRCIRDALEKCRVTPGRDCTKWMHHSNDCPNLHYCIQPMQYSKELCRDLAFLVPLGLKESNLGALVPFFVYCNSQNDAEWCATYLQSRVHGSLKKKIIWVHSGMSDTHKQRAVERFERGKLIGITAMESLGLVCVVLHVEIWNIYTKHELKGFNLLNITRLVQFCPPDNLCTLAQCFGCAARDPDTTGIRGFQSCLNLVKMNLK